MSLPEGYRSRPARWEDLESVVLVAEASDLVDVGFEDPVGELVADEWRRPGFDLERHTALVLADDASPIAYAEVFGPNPDRFVDSFARVHPAHRGRGVGSWIVDWMEEGARGLVPAGTTSPLRVHVPESDEGARRLLTARGYEPVRIFWHMRRELTGEIEPAALPGGIHARTFRHAQDARRVHDAMEEVFADHWGYESVPFDDRVEELARYGPGLSEVALDGGEVAGFLLAKRVEEIGWVDVVAVREPWRGRGIGRGLLLRSFAALAGDGATGVTLNVDSENASGATRVYESVGMHVHRAWLQVERPVRGDVS